MGLYQVGSMDFSAVEKVYEKLKQKIREEAAKGAAPAAKKSVTPIVLGAVGVSVLSLIIALRK